MQDATQRESHHSADHHGKKAELTMPATPLHVRPPASPRGDATTGPFPAATMAPAPSLSGAGARADPAAAPSATASAPDTSHKGAGNGRDAASVAGARGVLPNAPRAPEDAAAAASPGTTSPRGRLGRHGSSGLSTEKNAVEAPSSASVGKRGEHDGAVVAPQGAASGRGVGADGPPDATATGGSGGGEGRGASGSGAGGGSSNERRGVAEAGLLPATARMAAVPEAARNAGMAKMKHGGKAAGSSASVRGGPLTATSAEAAAGPSAPRREEAHGHNLLVYPVLPDIVVAKDAPPAVASANAAVASTRASSGATAPHGQNLMVYPVLPEEVVPKDAPPAVASTNAGVASAAASSRAIANQPLGQNLMVYPVLPDDVVAKDSPPAAASANAAVASAPASSRAVSGKPHGQNLMVYPVLPDEVVARDAPPAVAPANAAVASTLASSGATANQPHGQNLMVYPVLPDDVVAKDAPPAVASAIAAVASTLASSRAITDESPPAVASANATITGAAASSRATPHGQNLMVYPVLPDEVVAKDAPPAVASTNATVASSLTSSRKIAKALNCPKDHTPSKRGIPYSIDRPFSTTSNLLSAQQMHSQQVQLQRYRASAGPVMNRASQQQLLSGVSNGHTFRLPSSEEQAVTVAADLPPPPTSSDAWSSTSTSRSGGSNISRSHRKRATAKVAAKIAAARGSHRTPMHDQPMVASVHLANGGAIDVINTKGDTSSPPLGTTRSLRQESTAPQASAMHVTMEDPVSRKKMSLRHQHQKQPQQTKDTSKKPSPSLCAVTKDPTPEATHTGSVTIPKSTENSQHASNQNSSAKQQASAEKTAHGDDSCDSAKGSGSDEGYAASSEHQSGSGSDSVSSDDANKNPENIQSFAGGCGATGAPPACLPKTKVDGVTMAETSSMSSSVVAGFKGATNRPRVESPQSSSSISSSENNDPGASTENNKNTLTESAKKTPKKSSNKVVAFANSSKRSSLHRVSSTKSTHKRPKLASTLSSSAHDSSKNPAARSDATPANNTLMSGLSVMEKSLQQKIRSSTVAHHQHNHQDHYHSRSTGRKMLEKSFLSAKRDLSTANAAVTLASLSSSMSSSSSASKQQGGRDLKLDITGTCTGDQPSCNGATSDQEASIYSFGRDVIVQVVQFLEPPEILTFLTAPLSKTWLVTYTAPQELWKILCSSRPFYAKIDESICDSESSDNSSSSFPICNDLGMRHIFGQYRLLYTSFVRCMRYLNRLQDDALHGRSPSVYSNGNQGDVYPYHKNSSLKAYFAKQRQLVRSTDPHDTRNARDRVGVCGESGSSGGNSASNGTLTAKTESEDCVGNREGARVGTHQQSSTGTARSQLRFSRTSLTDRLFRPTEAGDVDHVNLPWSCAIYSVVNWMVAFADVEGIQVSRDGRMFCNFS